MTTCGRLDLFFKTMESFLIRCKDLDLITDWIVSDDRSSRNDIKAMNDRYPFLNIYSSRTPGQAANLNNLFSRVETDWFFHCEDDWLFTNEDNFIRKMFDITAADDRIKNVILRHWNGIYVVDGGTEYRAHYYNKRLGTKMINHADTSWYGYSLNPGLQHMPTVRKLGAYDEHFNIESRFWDRPPALEYSRLGLKRANLMDNYIEHIGDGQSVYTKE